MDPNGDMDMSDHLDVINMSLGSPFGYPGDPSAISSQAAADLGIIVVASAGNEGNVPYVTGAPAVADGAISVAASLSGGPVLGIDVSGDINDTYEAVEGTSPVRLSDGSVFGLLVQDTNTIGCDDTGGITVDMTGAIALISRGLCGFDEKSDNAEAKGAIGMVVYNDGASPSRVAPIVMGAITGGIPSVMIPSTDGFTLSSAIAGGASVSALLDEDITTDTAFFDLIADFSSRGPGHGGSTFKPDVTAPGVGTVSTAVGTIDGAASSSGTSMAAPHVAGVGALLHSLNPGMDPAGIKALIQNGTVDMQEFLPLTRQGVGRVDIPTAMELGSYASPGGVSFGRLNPESVLSLKETVEVTNFSDHGRSFTATHVPNQTLAGVGVSCQSRVSVAANNTSKFKITLTADPTMMSYDFPSFSQAEIDGWCILDDGDDTLRIGYTATIDPAARMKVVRNGAGIRVQNLGGQAVGFADGFTLTGQDGLILDGTENSIDAVGFRTADPDFWFGLPVVEIAYAAEVAWEAPHNLVWEIYISPYDGPCGDSLLLGIDFSAFGADPGDLITAQFGGCGSFLDWFISGMDFNDRVGSMPFTKFPYGNAPEKFDYFMVVYGRDGSIDIQEGTVDTAAEIIPEVINSFGMFGGGALDQSTDGSGDMLWLFPNNAAADQAQIVNVK